MLEARIGDLLGPGPGQGHDDKEEYARVLPRRADSGDRNLAVFERLAERLQRAPIELRKLVEE